MKRTDIHTILVPGSGAIVIGQAAEFDYSGTQAVKALKAEGYRVVLVNSNPATIMTDPDIADATYIEPLTPEALEAIIAQEKPDAMLPTVGGQTGLNLALALSENGVLEKYGVQLIGAKLSAIKAAEDRLLFRETMQKNAIPVPHGGAAYSLEEAEALANQTGYPVLVRASFAMGGTGASWVYEPTQLAEAVRSAISESPIGQAWLEESVLGWKEYELEVMRDKADNFVVVCSIENLDPMGVHTGDSLTVAPAQTLTDREYQILRDLAHRVLSAVGVETGGSNVQFGVDPKTGRVVVIEMNPRVSRSSALASKATGFPIAKLAALVAVGYTLNEITNDITKQTKAAFEPSLDYVVVKIPRWAFEKFPGVDPTLGPQMKSVGEVMALGTTFNEAFQKALRGLEIGAVGFGHRSQNSGVRIQEGNDKQRNAGSDDILTPDSWLLTTPLPGRIFAVAEALRAGATVEQVAAATGYDPWFVDQMAGLVAIEAEQAGHTLDSLPADLLREAKQHGFSDAQIADILQGSGVRGQGSGAVSDSRPLIPDPRPLTEMDVRAKRKSLGIVPVYHRIDTCAAEFEAHTPYMYSTYATEDESEVTDKSKAIILGGGPNRIGQGIEFDYCCVHACLALRDLGYETIMVNCNPETVSTDYDTSDRLYFEPLTLEDVLNIWERESSVVSGSLSVVGKTTTTDNRQQTTDSGVPVLVQFGGQTPLNLAKGLVAAGVPIWGTSQDAIDLAEDRGRFGELARQLEIE